jgi:MFS family permease
MTPIAPLRKAGRLQGIVLLLPVSLAVMGVIVLVPVVPQMMAHFAYVPGHEYLIQGGVLTMPALFMALSSPAGGWLADRFGRRRLLILAMVCYAIVGVAPVFMDNLIAIIATRVGVGIFEGIILTTTTILLCDYFGGAQRERWIAAQTAVASIASLPLVLMGGIFGARFGWRGPFYLYALSLILLLLVLACTWESVPSASVAGSPAANSARDYAIDWGRLLGICLITVFGAILFYAFLTQSALALTRFGVHDPAIAGMATMLGTLGVPVGTIVFPRIARFAVGLLLTVEFGVIAVGYIGMGKSLSLDQFVAMSAVMQFGCGLLLPTLVTWAVRPLPFFSRGRGTGAWQGSFALGQFFSGLVTTWLAQRVGGLSSAFLVLGVLSLIAAVLATLLHLRLRVPARSASYG